MASRSKKVTLQLTEEEAFELGERAKAVGQKLSPFIREQILSGGPSPDTALVLGEMGATREALARMLVCLASGAGLDQAGAREIIASVQRMDRRGFVGLALAAPGAAR
jgi:hypothetical protein